MKRELKPKFESITTSLTTKNCRAYPDEKGIETGTLLSHVTRPGRLQSLSRWKGNWNLSFCSSWGPLFPNCRAYPDEKGIETTLIWSKVGVSSNILQSLSRWKGNWNVKLGNDTFQHTGYCRAYPDEKGIETTQYPKKRCLCLAEDCRAYPDEKGIETF